MSALRDLADMNRNFGLGSRYFMVVAAILAVLLSALFLWGRVEADADAAAGTDLVVPAPAASGSSPPSY